MPSSDRCLSLARSHWGSASLGDPRRTERAVSLGASLVGSPGSGLAAGTGSWGSLKAAYRLLHRPEATHAALQAPHRRLVLGLAGSERGTVLFVQDRTELDFRSRAATAGLGHTGGNGRGLEVHTALAALPGAGSRVLGAAWQKVWAREHPPRKRTETQEERDARPKESDVWAETLEALGPVPEGARWVSVGDRESDLFPYFARAAELGWEVLARARHDRRLEGEEGLSSERVRALPAAAETRLRLRARPGAPAREARLSLSWTRLDLRAPKRVGGPSLGIWAVRVWEEDPPEGTEPLEWILLSSSPVGSEEDALERVAWYRRRWLVEEYHKCLKTGCRMESSQLRDRGALEALLGFLGVVAALMLAARSPDGAPEPPPEAFRAVSRLAGREVPPGDARLFWREVARLGGFLARKGDGEPGWQTLWKGWLRLRDVLLGIRIAEETTRCG